MGDPMSRMKKKEYEEHLQPLELELNDLARWLRHTGQRMVVIFEGRDTAGKGGVISAIAAKLNPRQVHVVALGTPTERERSQWYFQRYVPHLPAAGELVMFDRSWYNRAGVEKVMGFCNGEEYERFLKEAPVFERLLIDEGILLLKYWLSVDQKWQEERFAERAEDPRKRWKLSAIDIEHAGATRSTARPATPCSPPPTVRRRRVWWTHDQRRGWLNLIRHLLDHTPDRKVPEPMNCLSWTRNRRRNASPAPCSRSRAGTERLMRLDGTEAENT